MFKILLRKEIVSHILTLRFAVSFVLIVLFVFAGFFVSVTEFKRNTDDYHATERMARYGVERISKETNPEQRVYRLWDEGTTVAVPVPALSSVSQGLSAVWPAAVNVSGQGVTNLGKSLMRNPLSRVFPVPDYVYIINAILTLLAMLFIFDSVCGEKEAGTLRLMLSFSVPRAQVLLCKWLGGYIVLLVPFGVATLGGLGYAWTQGALELTAGNVLLLSLTVGIAVLYFSAFFTLGLFISTVTQRAFTSLFLCLFVWVFFILIIPNVAPILGRIVTPIPSPRKIEAEKNAVSREIEMRMENIYRSVEGSADGGMEQKLQKLREEGEYRRDRWDRFLRQAQEKQTRFSETVGRLSPSSSWIFSAHSLLKTGPAAYQTILDGRSRLKKEMEALLQSFWQHWEKFNEPPNFKPDQIPVMKIAYYDTGKAVAGALNDVLLLMIYNILFFMAAFLFFLRYDVR